MSALGYAATGAGQGYVEGRQYNDERGNQRTQQRQQQQQIDLQAKAQADAQANARRQEGLTRAGQLESIFRDPNSARLYRPGELDKLRAEYDSIKTQYPDLYPGSAPQVPGEVLPGGPVAAAAAETNAPHPSQPPAPIPELYNVGQPQAAPDPLNTMNVGTGASDFNPMSPTPINPGAPITGSQNPPVAGSFPLDPRVGGQAPAPLKPSAPAPVKAAPVQPQAPETPAMRLEVQAKKYYEMSKDPKYSEAEQEHFTELGNAAVDRASQLRERESGIQLNQANAAGIKSHTTQEQLTGHAQRQQTAEAIASSMYERNVLNPAKLSLEQASQSISRGQLALARLQENHQDKQARAQLHMEAQKLHMTDDQFAKELGFKYAELGQQRDIAAGKLGAVGGKLSDVDKMEGDVLGKAAFNTTPMGKVTGPSPIYNTWKDWLQAHRTGASGSASGAGDQGAKVKQYLARTDLTPEQKIGGLKQLGIPPPPDLLAKARGKNARH